MSSRTEFSEPRTISITSSLKPSEEALNERLIVACFHNTSTVTTDEPQQLVSRVLLILWRVCSACLDVVSAERSTFCKERRASWTDAIAHRTRCPKSKSRRTRASVTSERPRISSTSSKRRLSNMYSLHLGLTNKQMSAGGISIRIQSQNTFPSRIVSQWSQIGRAHV